jgi:glycosyl transferase family 25
MSDASRIAVRVISLAGSDRRRRMAEQLDPLGLEWSFFDACTSPSPALAYDPERAEQVHGRPLTQGEVGCFSSHYELWRWFAGESGADLLVILEDDLIIDPVFFARLAEARAAMGTIDYLRLYAKVPAGVRREGPFLQRHVARFSGRAYGTQAYLLTRGGARRFLHAIRRIERPIDDEMDRFWVHRLPIRAVFPFPVMEVAYGSTIEAVRRGDTTLPRLKRLRWLGIRGVEKARRHAADLVGRIRP